MDPSKAPAGRKDSTQQSPQTENFSINLWEEALAYCKNALGRQDFEKVEKLKNCEELLRSLEDMHREYESDTIRSFLTMVEPCISHVHGFVMLVALSLRQDIVKTALVWGLLDLVIKLCARSSDISSKLLPWLDQMTSDLRLFKEYEWLFKLNPELQESLLLVFVEVIKFWSLAVKYLRRSPNVNLATSPWSDVHAQFSATLQRIQRYATRLKESAQAATSRILYEQQAKMVQELGNRLEESNLACNAATEEDVTLPCDNIPFAKYPHFCGRQEILKDLHHELDNLPGQRQMKSWALWGMGGIGKTQIALAYAYERLEQGLQALFWVKSETLLDISQGFTDIAITLNINGVSPDGDHEQNRYLVMRWLQKTSTPWLIVFDNVENPEHIQKFWPAGKSGSILLTTRNRAFEVSPASGGCRVPVLTEAEGSKFLQSLLGRKVYSQDEIDSAKALCRAIDGLPLALNLMGGQIRARGRKIQQFLHLYQEHSSRLLKPNKPTVQSVYYRHDIDTVWETSFEPLDVDSTRVMAILSFLSPEDIPQALFLPSSMEHLPSELEFCKDALLFDEYLMPLLGSSLITNDETTDHLRIHRLVQDEFRGWLTVHQRYQAFLHASWLLFEAFPKQAHGLPLRNEWPICKQYVQHVMTLCTRYEQYKFAPANKGDFEPIARLLASCGWYLMESGSWSEFDQMMRVADAVCEDKSGLLFVQISNTAAVVELERCQIDKAWPLIKQVRKTREKLLPPDHKDIADCYTTYGNLLMTEMKSKDSLTEVERLFDRAIEIDRTHGDDHCNGIMHIRYGNNGVLYNLQGRREEAIRYIELGRDHAIQLFGKDTHFDATADYDVGKVYYDQGDWEKAKQYFERAHSVFLANNPIQSATTAVQLKLACISMKQGKLVEAIDTLRETILISKIKETSKGNRGETARVMRRLAEALHLNGEVEEAEALKSEAEAIRRQIQGTRFEELGDTEQSYNMLVYVAFW